LAQHGGRLEIESQEGRGTRVVISIPSVFKNEAPVAAPAPPVAPKKALRILVADDEPMIREVIQMYLSEDNHVVESAVNGREALEKFMESDYDVVLTDRSMPELNGDELAVAVKKHRPNVPVILLTGFGEVMKAEGERPAGVDAIIAKPFTLEVLRAALAKV
jgi:CheY-like chemotaxis protein